MPQLGLHRWLQFIGRESKLTEPPKVYCQKEDREVPIWWCLGSYIMGRVPCPELLEATVKIDEGYAKVKCKAQGGK